MEGIDSLRETGMLDNKWRGRKENMKKIMRFEM